MTHRPALAGALALGFLVAGTAVSPAHGDPWRQERFLVGGWIPGTPQTAEQLLTIERAGLDYFHTYATWISGNRDVMARLDSLAAARPGFRLKAIAHLTIPFTDPGRVAGNDDPAKNWPAVRKNLAPEAGVNRRSLLGWHVGDEPLTRAAIARCAEMTRRLRDHGATEEQLPYVNLLSAVRPEESGDYRRDFGSDRRSAYAAYVRAWLSAFDRDDAPAPVLSFDLYPFQATKKPASSWFLTLAVVRDEARAKTRPDGQFVPVWAVIQSSDHRPRGRSGFARTFDAVQLRWQAWSAVAYGAKGIAYWTLSPVEDKGANLGFDAAILDAKNRATPFVATMRALNDELHALGPTLMELEALGARHVSIAGQEGIADETWTGPGGAARPLGPLAGVAAERGDANDALVTLFRHREDGGMWVFVFNKSLSAARSFRVRLDRPAKVERLRRSDGRAEPVAAAGATSFLTGPLPAGTGDLFRLEP